MTPVDAPSSREPDSKNNHAQKFRSSVRYWIASLTLPGSMPGFPVRSASVRLTLRIRSYARADKPSRVIAFSSKPFDSESIAQYFRINRGDICALQKIRSLAKRSNCTRRARTTLSRMSDELSPGASLASSLNFTAGTSI